MTATGRRSVGRTLAITALAGLVGITGLTAYATFRVWQRGEIDDAAPPSPVDAIVVLGAAQYDGRPSPVVRARLDHAIDLWRSLATAGGRRPALVMTGGRQEGDRTTEAATGRQYALSRGVPATDIRMEDRGRSTLESLQAVAGILAGEGLHRTILVSDPTHMLRVMRMAEDLGIDARGSPATLSPTGSSAQGWIDAVAHELGALAWYGLTGRTFAEQPGAGTAP